MMKKFLFAFCLLLGAGVVHAQDDNDNENGNNTGGFLAIGLGGAVNYYYGQAERNFNSFDRDRVNWQLDGLLGISLGRNKAGNRTLLAAFGTYGFNNRSTLQQIFADQNYVTSPTVTQSSTNSFYRLEGGLLLGEIFRISTGVGQQMFDRQPLVRGGTVNTGAESLQFYSSTVGFQFKVSAVSLMVNVNFAYGQDYDRTVLSPAAGLMFRL